MGSRAKVIDATRRLNSGIRVDPTYVSVPTCAHLLTTLSETSKTNLQSDSLDKWRTVLRKVGTLRVEFLVMATSICAVLAPGPRNSIRASVFPLLQLIKSESIESKFNDRCSLYNKFGNARGSTQNGKDTIVNKGHLSKVNRRLITRQRMTRHLFDYVIPELYTRMFCTSAVYKLVHV